MKLDESGVVPRSAPYRTSPRLLRALGSKSLMRKPAVPGPGKIGRLPIFSFRRATSDRKLSASRNAARRPCCTGVGERYVVNGQGSEEAAPSPPLRFGEGAEGVGVLERVPYRAD